MMRAALTSGVWLCALALGSAMPCAGAAGLPGDLAAYVNRSVVSPGALADTLGRISVNQAAGDLNAQINAAVVVMSPGAGSATLGIHQDLAGHPGSSPSTASTHIGAGAFSHASGLVAINQTSGQGNAQANAVVLGLGAGAHAVTDSQLALTTSNAITTGTGDGSGSHQQALQVSIADTAFDDAGGVIQVNQSAGSGNATANTFVLSIGGTTTQ